MKEKLGSALEIAQAKRREEDRRYIMSTVGQDIAKMMGPFLADVASSAKVNREEMKACMLEVMANVNARQMPGVDTKPITDAIERAMGGMYIPEPKVTVTSPAVNIPDIKMPDHMDIKGWVSLMTHGGAVGHDNPLPVMLMDTKGNPLKLFENLTSIVSGGSGGGKHDFYTIKGFSQSAYSELMNADGRIKVSVETGGSGLTDSELRATAVPVSQVSGANWSVTASLDTTVALYNGDNRLRVSVETGGSGLTDAELRASSLPVEQVSGSIWSTNVLTMPAVVVTSITNTIAANVVDSGGVVYSGSNPLPISGAVSVSGAITSTGAYLLNGDGAYRDTVPVSGTVVVSSVTASTQATIIDSGGVGYSGSNPVPVTLISGALTSTIAVGVTVADAVDDNSAPIKAGGIARTANPTAVAGGDIVSSSYDDLGRTLTRPIQVRDLTQTAYATFATGTEATLIAGVASTFLDLIYIMGANNSDAAVSVDIRSGTGGSVLMTLQIPASGTAGVALPVPLPQEVVAGAWTVDLPDITGTTVSVSALFSKEV